MEYSEGTSFAQLVAKRRSAEEVYRRVRALERLSVLANTKTRQPVRTYASGDLVKVWRRKEWFGIARPHWWGPGRVVLQETLPRPQASRHGDGDDEARRHIVWVLVGGHVMRCSALSVRPLSDREQALSEMSEPTVVPQDLRQVLSNGHYEDISGDVPAMDETEATLPSRPPPAGVSRAAEAPPAIELGKRRKHGKTKPTAEELANEHQPMPMEDVDVPADDDLMAEALDATKCEEQAPTTRGDEEDDGLDFSAQLAALEAFKQGEPVPFHHQLHASLVAGDATQLGLMAVELQAESWKIEVDISEQDLCILEKGGKVAENFMADKMMRA